MKKKLNSFLLLLLTLIFVFSLSFSSNATLLGDVNLDGKITASDARTILRFSAKLESPATDKVRVLADIDGDKKISSIDARRALRMSALLDKTVVYTEKQTVPYSVVNNNIPNFKKSDMTTKSFERYSVLDSLGRCGVAFANVGTDLMPTDQRGEIGMVKPSGWHTIKYDCIKDRYLYNRCHLIGYQLTAENANVRNLITGTRYLNVEGMLPFENQVASYVKKTHNHVLYRVTPDFRGKNLVANGVQIEALSVEDNGKGVKFNVYCYNIQPGIEIDYLTGNSHLADSSIVGTTNTTTTKKYATTTRKPTTTTKRPTTTVDSSTNITYVLNTSTKKIHYQSCRFVAKIKAENKSYSKSSLSQLISQGYSKCGYCF